METIPRPDELLVARLGEGVHPSPLAARGRPFVDEAARVLVCSDAAALQTCLARGEPPPAFEPAGPRPRLFFDPATLTCGVVTCGGLCPGLNNVIRALTLVLTHGFGVRRVLGFRYGYAGLAARSPHRPLVLTSAVVDHIHQSGGTILGSSRDLQDPGDMVDTLVRERVGLLFAIGGDGTLRGASALAREIGRRDLPIGVIGIPKTIDNDIPWIDRSFGFATAVAAADVDVAGAHEEARGAWNGIGIVKLMGRESGFIAAHATLANNDVNFCLVPEVPFALDGEDGFLTALERRLADRHHAVIVLAEGAGQELVCEGGVLARDASGNPRLGDIGHYLRDRIVAHLEARGVEATVKYIDPSYTIRSLPANSVDAAYCLALAHHAVHAGLAGRTDMMVGHWNQRYTHVPLGLVATAGRRRLDPEGEVWQRVLEGTGQPRHLGGGTAAAR